MTHNNLNVVRSIYDALGKGDVQNVMASMDPNIVWNEADNFPYADGNPYVGPEAVADGVFKRLASEWEYFDVNVESMLDAGDSIVALGHYQGKNKSTSEEIDAQFAHVWKIRDGKAATFQQYTDTAQVRNAVTDS
jgi:ketosteroid isomerase-like protein